MSRALGAIAFGLGALTGAGWLAQRAGARRDARRYPAPGSLLPVGGRELHVVQMGTGEPAVVFEAGLAASSVSWACVQPLVASFAKAVSYDRAGLGWSSPLVGAPTLGQMLEDLRRVVDQTAQGGRVVLVGHSFGALLVLGFARRYPELVAGLVLVDPVSLASWAQGSAADLGRLRVGARLSRRGALLAEFGIVRSALAILLGGNRPVSRFIGRRAAGRGASTLERLTGEVGKLPQELWPVVASHWSRPHNFRAMADVLEGLPGFAGEVSPVELVEEMPVAVLSAASATVEELRERDGWLAGVSRARHVMLPETGHWLHLERPVEVADAVRWCVGSARLA